MRVAINLLTDDPRTPSGAHWFWKQVITEMVPLLAEDEELHLVVSPKIRDGALGYGPRVRVRHLPVVQRAPRAAHAERAGLRAAAAAPLGHRCLQHPDRTTGQAGPGLVAHFKTLHAFTMPEDDQPAGALVYRRTGYPHTARVADVIIINSESLRQEIETHSTSTRPSCA
jgi:hypothetical protein